MNPSDTGFDENSHVMKFAAVAKDVTTLKQIQPKLDLQQIEASPKRLRINDEDLLTQLNEFRTKVRKKKNPRVIVKSVVECFFYSGLMPKREQVKQK